MRIRLLSQSSAGDAGALAEYRRTDEDCALGDVESG